MHLNTIMFALLTLPLTGCLLGAERPQADLPECDDCPECEETDTDDTGNDNYGDTEVVEDDPNTSGVDELLPRITVEFVPLVAQYIQVGYNAATIEVSLESNMDAQVTQIPFTITSTDNDETGWNSCQSQGESHYFSVIQYMGVDEDGYDTSVKLEATWEFYSLEGSCEDTPTSTMRYAVATVDIALFEGEPEWVTMAYEAASTPSTELSDTTQTSISWLAEFNWETMDGQSLDGITVDGLPTASNVHTFVD
ncbi:hypothetical protein HN358_00205 [Candidatus Uhrbacteria bacterium]|jgi:hypothetical protein|nr:hypothetical protein [Candidatus Uhrbacteria bacterium]MBT7717271.1 hypothetical protein [Candidatus Uhrbacteria bacterium]